MLLEACCCCCVIIARLGGVVEQTARARAHIVELFARAVLFLLLLLVGERASHGILGGLVVLVGRGGGRR